MQRSHRRGSAFFSRSAGIPWQRPPIFGHRGTLPLLVADSLLHIQSLLTWKRRKREITRSERREVQFFENFETIIVLSINLMVPIRIQFFFHCSFEPLSLRGLSSPHQKYLPLLPVKYRNLKARVHFLLSFNLSILRKFSIAGFVLERIASAW
jgi:hypothetical protein